MGFAALDSRATDSPSLTSAAIAMPPPLPHRVCLAIITAASLLLYGIAFGVAGLLWPA